MTDCTGTRGNCKLIETFRQQADVKLNWGIGSPCLERSALLQNRVSKLQNRATRYNETTGTGTSLCI